MIVEYHRPETLQAALELLSRKNPRTLPLGGGTHLSHYRGEPIAVVDLHNLGLGKVERTGNSLKIGAAATLQDVVNFEDTPSMFKELVRFETNYNLRQSATAAGTLVSGDGKSPFICGLLALDAFLVLEPGGKEVTVENWLGNRSENRAIALITTLVIPLDTVLKYDFVGRSPVDIPIVSVTIGKWTSGRTRVVIGGFGAYPVLAMDGTDLSKVDYSIKNACSQLHPTNNSEYILEIAKTLAGRLVGK